MMKRIAVAYEAAGDGFWLARGPRRTASRPTPSWRNRLPDTIAIAGKGLGIPQRTSLEAEVSFRDR
jgi:hypothetical protein